MQAMSATDEVVNTAPALHAEWQVSPVFCLALAQNAVPLIDGLTLTNRSACRLSQLTLVLAVEPELGPIQHLPLGIDLDPGETLTVGPIDFSISARYLRGISEREPVALVWQLREGETTLARGEVPFVLQPPHHWPHSQSWPGLLGAFVLPNDPVVTALVRQVSDTLLANGHDRSLEGYQSRDTERVRRLAATCYDVLETRGFTYVSSPPSFEASGQKIRLPEALWGDRMGCCLDLAVLNAAMLEQMGLNPLLILLDGHALVGVWLEDDGFAEGVIQALPRLRNEIALNRLLIWDATTATATRAQGWAQSCKTALSHLQRSDTFDCALDVGVLRRVPIRPLALRRPLINDPQPPEGPVTPVSPPVVSATAHTSEQPASDSPIQARPLSGRDARFARWQEQLLDLSLRNRLLNFSLTAKSALPLAVPDPVALMKQLLQASAEFLVQPAPRGLAGAHTELLARADASPDEPFARFERLLSRGQLPGALTETEHLRRLRHLVHHARVSWEESGAHTLYVAVGLLRYGQGGKGAAARGVLAPLALCPVDVTLDRTRGGYRLRWTGDDVVPNVSLFEKLRRDHEVDLSGAAQWLNGDDGPDFARYFKQIRQGIKRHEHWEIEEEAHLGLFSFTKFLMWRDLADNQAHLLQNAVVAHIASPDHTVLRVPEASTVPDLEDIPCVLDADSSQLEAIKAALTGESFVLQGPPGTGKSQTITNMIAAMLAEGKRVLFVSEKMAALQVVYERLGEVGLGDFCLNLHHHENSKKAFYQSLKSVYQRANRVGEVPWDSRIDAIRQLREALKGPRDALNRTTPVGFSVQEALLRHLQLERLVPLKGSYPGIEHWDATRWNKTLSHTAQFFERIRDIAPLAQNPWRGFNPGPWDASLRFELEALLDRIPELVASLTRTDARFFELLQMAPPDDPRVGSRAMELARHLVKGILSPVAFEAEWPHWRARGEAFLRLDASVQELWAELQREWPVGLAQLDEHDLLARFQRGQQAPAWLHWLTMRGVRHALQALRPGVTMSDDDLRATLERLRNWREGTRWLQDEHESLWPVFELDEQATTQAFATRFHEICEALEAHQSLGELAGAIARAVSILEGSPGPEWQAFGSLLETHWRDQAELASADARLRTALGVEASHAWPRADQPGHREGLLALCERLLPAWAGMQAWCFYQETCVALQQNGLGWLVDAHQADQLPTGVQSGQVELGMLQAWLRARLKEEPALARFYGPEFERTAAQFAETDGDMRAISRRLVLMRLEARLPQAHPEVAERSEPGLLMREAAKKTRQMPLRVALGKMPHLIARLKPCFLMSPLSVAQFLPAEDDPFDVVIFDEASQIGTHDAIGAIARGRQVIIVGDSQQLPPTRFFRRKNDDDALPDECDVIELESILDEAVAKELPVRMLNWHYRSRHDDLIAFSNRHHYQNRLQIFPPAARQVPDRGVKWHPIPDATYLGAHADEDGEAGTNPKEAAALVTHLVQELKQTPPGSRSFGVVTFNLAQQMLILDLLDAARTDDPTLDPYFSGSEAVFVKNLENVQGDERDVIYFSICYAPDRQGRMRMAFGPLGMTGGERRLNVAITRARLLLRVFTSIDAQAIDLNRAGSVGARHLKAFLRFASSRAQSPDASTSPHVATHPLIASLQQALQNAGHVVDTEVGTGSYRMALAIRHPEQPGAYALGIEVDAGPQSEALTLRDLERIRPALLQSLGWTRHRVMALGWWLDRDGQWQRLTRAIDVALSPPQDDFPTPAPEPVVNGPVPDETRARIPSDSPPTKPYQRHGWPSDDAVPSLVDLDALRLQAIIHELIQVEGPIPEKLLVRRLADHLQLARVSDALSKRVRQGVQFLIDSEQVQAHDSTLWHADQNSHNLTRCRVGERDAAYWVPEEIALLLEWVLTRNVSLTPELATREVGRWMGTNRPGRHATEAVQRAMGILLTRGVAHLSDEGHWVGQPSP